MAADDRPLLDAALGRFLDEEPEPGDDPALAAALGQDPRLADELRRLLVIDALLRQSAELDPAAFAESVGTRLAAEADGDRFTAAVLDRLPPPAPRRKRLRWAVALACVTAAAALVWALWPGGWNADPTPHAPVPPGPAAVGGPDFLPAEPAAVLVNEADARFAPGAGPDGGRFLRGDYQLLSGVVHLRFASGAEVVLRSPARFTVLDRLNVALAEGTLRAIVPHSAHRFTVHAAGVRYIDLGTEFGVSVGDQPGESRLQVFEGRVDLQTRDGQPLSSVEDGQSVRVSGGRVESTGPMPLDQFPAPDAIGLEKWHHWRDRFQKDPSLLCYYPFLPDAADPAVLKDHAAEGGRLDGRIEGARWVTGRWPGKQALLFDRDGDHVGVSVPGTFRQLTLAAWVRLDRLDFELNAVFNSDGWQPGALHWQVKRRGDCFFGHWGRPLSRRTTGPRVPLGQWAHLAAVADLDRHATQIYVNGELAEELRLANSQGPFTPGSCRMGDWLRRPEDTSVPRRGLRGRIDEFAFWRRALTRDEVRELFVAGRPALSPGD